MADLREAAERAAKRAKERRERDLALALDIYDGAVYHIGPFTIKPPTGFTMLILEEQGALAALTGDLVSLGAIAKVLAIIDLTDEPGKLPGTKEERASVIERRAFEMAAQVPAAEYADFIARAIQAIGHMLTPPDRQLSEGGDSDIPFSADNPHRPDSEGAENEAA